VKPSVCPLCGRKFGSEIICLGHATSEHGPREILAKLREVLDPVPHQLAGRWTTEGGAEAWVDGVLMLTAPEPGVSYMVAIDRSVHVWLIWHPDTGGLMATTHGSVLARTTYELPEPDRIYRFTEA